MRETGNGLRALIVGGLAALIVILSPAHARADAKACAAVPDALAKFQPPEGAAAVSDVPFLDAGEKEVTLADWRGNGLVVNFWATWCPPCVEEMPALDALHAALAGDGIAVLAVSSDMGGANVVRTFYERNKIEHLAVLTDARSRMGQSLGVFGLPTTILFDPAGREVGRVLGPAEWDAPELAAFLRTCLAPAG